MSFYKSLVGSVDSRGESAGRSKVSDSSSLPKGDSLRSYMQPTSDSVTEEACILQSMSRRDRRASLSRRSAADRRRMIAETVRVRRRVQDSDISYSPEVCWAINAIVRSDSEEGYALLRKRYAALPSEVQEFYDAYVKDRYSTAAAEAYSRLGNYRIVKDDDSASDSSSEDAGATSGGDRRLNSYMEGAVALESGVDKIISETRDATAQLTHEAEEALESAKRQASEEAEAFAERVSEVYSDAVDTAISAQVQQAAVESASALVEQEVAEGSDADVDDNNIASLQGELTAEATAEEDDATPQDVQDSADPAESFCAGSPAAGSCAQGSVGCSVQIVYMGNIYSGVLSAMGDGSALISGLPTSLFHASEVAAAPVAPAVSEEVLVVEEEPALELESAALDEESQSAPEEVPVAEASVAEVSAEESLDLEVTDAEGSVPPSVPQVLARVLEGEDLLDESGDTGILYDEDGDVFIFMTPLYTESISVDSAASWLAAHLEDFGAVLGAADAAHVVEDDATVEATASEAVAEGPSGEVTEDVTETVTEGVQEGASEDVVEDPLSAGVIPDILTGDPIQWESVESASQAWASDHSLSLATNPEDSNLTAALTALSEVLSPYLSSLRVDPSVDVLYLADKPFVTLSGASVNVGTVSFIPQTDATGIASFAQQFAKAVVQLAHLLVGDAQGSTQSQEVTDGELLSEEAKQEVLQSVEEEVKRTLEEAGVTVEDSADIPTVTDRVQDSAPNNYDIPHTLSSFRKIRNTRKVLDSVLALASTIAGTKITASKYRSMQNGGGKRNRQLLQTVLDAVFLTDNLDLVCDSLYRRKLGDTFWVCDSADKVARAFKVATDITGPCLVSSVPFDVEVAGDRVVDSVPVGAHTLYFLRQ